MAGIDGELPEGATLISVMHMVNPSTFWISETPSKDMTQERLELEEMENELQKHCRHVKFYNPSSYMPEQGELVAVEHPETHRWHRGRVEEVLNLASGFMYKVFLVDHGVPMRIHNSSMQELHSSFQSLNYQALHFVLYGVLPVTRQLQFENTDVHTQVMNHWTSAAVKFVKGLLKEASKTYILYHRNTKQTVYGDLYLELEDRVISLKKELCDNEYAIFSEELFAEDSHDISGRAFTTSTDGNSSHDRTSCKSLKTDTVKSGRHNIREYLSEFYDRKKVKDSFERIEQWRQNNASFEENK
ncbi:hypothetical protein L9F63_017707, partial [Diploptera punctata]